MGGTWGLTAVASTPILRLVEVGAFFGRWQFDLGNSGHDQILMDIGAELEK